jgi:hypothetical protein
VVAWVFSKYVKLVDSNQRLFTFFLAATLLYDLPAAHRYIASFAEFTVRAKNATAYIMAGVAATALLIIPRKLLYAIKMSILLPTLAAIILKGATPLGGNINPAEAVTLAVFAYIGFTLPMDTARKAMEQNGVKAAEKAAVGAALGFGTITALYTALAAMGYYGMVRYAPTEKIIGVLLGLLGLTSYAGFLQGLAGLLEGKVGRQRALIAVTAINVAIPIIVLGAGLRIEHYLAAAGLFGGLAQYLFGAYLIAGISFLKILKQSPLPHYMDLRNINPKVRR